MTRLDEESCVPCHAGEPPLTEKEIEDLSKQVEGWQVNTENSVNKLVKSYKLKNFRQALAFTNMVGVAAEEVDHHPAILTEWGKVTLTWWTHAIKGLHRNDFIMAAKSDRLVQGIKQSEQE
jgi:4a-hydroxytetrahydrobiopterin dehydratase